MERAASQLRGRDGEVRGFERVSEYATADLAYIVELQHTRVRPGGADEIASVSLRVTTIFRRENGEWRGVHRHADTITGPRPLASILEQ